MGTRRPGNGPPPPLKGPGHSVQAQRNNDKFQEIEALLDAASDDTLSLSTSSDSITPEGALVFQTGARIDRFAKVAAEAGFEVLSEYEISDFDDEEGLFDTSNGSSVNATLYTTMPSEAALREMLRLWRLYKRGENAQRGFGTWWRMFDMLVDLRRWGPQDRLTENAKAEILQRLSEYDDDQEALIELEIWPTNNTEKRARWRRDAIERVRGLDGQIVDQSTIEGDNFVYEALLASLSAGHVRRLIEAPEEIGGLATLEGLQFVLPQTIGQSGPVDDDSEDTPSSEESTTPFDSELLERCVLFDGVPVAGHPALDGGVNIEDVHGLVDGSLVAHRHHATAMASLILRGDLEADGEPLADSRLISIPVLIDGAQDTASPPNRLFVDVIHTALVAAFSGPDALAPDAFVVNFSIGIRNMRFAGRVSALARLLDWWSWKEGVLFIVSAGNISTNLIVKNTTATAFEDAEASDRRATVRKAIADQLPERALLAPAEALNVLTVGALSEDHAQATVHKASGIFDINDDCPSPQISSARGPGPSKAIKPEVLASGGVMEIRAHPNAPDVALKAVPGQRTGLVAAAPSGGTLRSRGTSNATALTTRAILQSAASLVEAGGPYEGQELPRKDLSLLTRALAVNAAYWTPESDDYYKESLERLGSRKYHAAKQSTAQHLGFGALDPLRMLQSPVFGATLIGLADIKKDNARTFDVCLPPSLSGEKLPRSLRVTLAWFSPVSLGKSTYRLAKLRAIAAESTSAVEDNGWVLDLKTDGLQENMVNRGTIWSRRLVHNAQKTPVYGVTTTIPVRVQCQEATTHSLSPDDTIRFAIAVSLEVEAETQFDVFNEIKDAVTVRLQGGS